MQFFEEPSLLAQCVYTSFYDHLPLKLNPNVIWLTILQGFGIFVSRNSEALREKFVNHSGKQKIVVERSDFTFGNPLNDWESIFPQFADEIGSRTHPGIRELLECNYSNTTPTDRACSHIALMDICQHYFKFEALCGCGIPRIDLLGTVEDWRLVRTKAEGLKRFESPKSKKKEIRRFSVWLGALLPALDHFVSAAEGNPEIAFWASVCNVLGFYGEATNPITGWISVFYPYRQMRPKVVLPNPLVNEWKVCFDNAKKYGIEGAMAKAIEAFKAFEREMDEETYEMDDKEELEDRRALADGMDLSEFPPGLSSAPVCVKRADVGMEQDVRFYGGVFAVHQHPDGALEARTGWAVVEEPGGKKKKKLKKKGSHLPKLTGSVSASKSQLPQAKLSTLGVLPTIHLKRTG
jgi:hypothetical protein